MTFRSQPDRMSDPAFQAESKKMATEFETWFDMGSQELIAKVRSVEAEEGRRVYIHPEYVGDKQAYESFVYFIPRGSSPDHPALGGFSYDEDYLKNKFFPDVLYQVLPESNQNDPSHPQLAMTIRKTMEQTPLAASLCWNGGTPEVERAFDSVFPGLILGIRPEGTTIADLSRHILRLAFTVLGRFLC